MQEDITQWKLFDAYKVNYNYDIEIEENGSIIDMNSTNGLSIVGANFSSVRRQNLKGAIVWYFLYATKNMVIQILLIL